MNVHANAMSDMVGDLLSVIASNNMEIRAEKESLRLCCDVFERDGVYAKEGRYGIEVLSNFVLSPVERIDGDGWAQVTMDIIPQLGETVRHDFPVSVLSKLARFKEELDQISFRLSFRGTQSDMDDIKLLINGHRYNLRQGVKHIGMHRSGTAVVFVSQTGAIDAIGEACSTFGMHPDSVNVKTDLLSYEPIQADELQRIIGPLFGFNEMPVVVTIMGYVGSSFLREALQAADIKHGSLVMTGDSGGGKSTTLEQVIQPVFACEDAISAFDLTDASLRHAVGSSNMVPVVIEEFKPLKLNKASQNLLCNTLRSLYDGHQAQLCTGTMKVAQLPLRASIIIVGEAAPNETAIRERCLQVLFSKSRLEQHPEYEEAMAVLRKQRALLPKLGRALLLEAMNFDIQELREGHEKMMAAVPLQVGRWPMRVRNQYVNALLGLELMDRVCIRQGLSLETMIGKSANELAEALEGAIREYLLDGRDNNRSVIDETLVVMFTRMGFVEEADYKYLNTGSELALDVKGIYDRFTHYVRKNRIDCESLPLEQFMQQLKCQSYYKDNKPVRIGKKMTRCTVLDAAELQDYIGDAVPDQTKKKVKAA